MSTVPINEVVSERDFGGKAVHLGAAARAGLPVPPGIALSVDLVEAIATGDESALIQVETAMKWTGVPVAVRSSAVGEDSASASFAGQHTTVLNATTPERVLEAIRLIWESGRSQPVMAYRHRHGITDQPRIAAVLQKMVESESAGVLFTRNPLTGKYERLIEAAWGLGEVVVAGLVTPDQYRIACDGTILERIPGEKDIALRNTPEGGTIEVEITDNRVWELCLNDNQLLQLHQLASQCEAAFGEFQDIEWAFAESLLFLLQCRAITTDS